MTVPVCPLCDAPMKYLYTDLKGKRFVYKCRTCGYREEEYNQDGTDSSSDRSEWDNPSNHSV